ncbi:MAG: hypothetical protein E7596_03245 [Ruminococcaceae bacterium]|nr:hypothetical protein [Oscillospiraceae bacterium]
MKLMSFNTQHCLNYLEQRVDYDIMARAILDCGADIVGLNEMFDKGNGAVFGAQTEKLSKLTGLKNWYFAKAIDDADGPYGNGFLSKYPIKNAETVIIPDPNPREYSGFYETRCVLKAELENGITVLVTHFGLNPDEQRNAVKTVLEHITPNKCILMGDFNITPENELLKPIKEKMTDTSLGFFENKGSWPSDTPTVKIDYIFVTPDIEVVSADIPTLIASDHRPHLAEIEI